MASDETPIRGRIADIELLRGIAIVFVLIEHIRINLLTWTGGEGTPLYHYFGFWTGVDLFFAISGFVIARSLLRSLDGTSGFTEFFNVAIAFWVRRAWRLLPSAWLWLGLIMFAVFFLNRSGAFGTFRANFEASIAGILQVANFRVLIVFQRYAAGASFPYWSLSLEEQFYLLLPFAIFLARRRLPYLLAFAIAAQFFIRRGGPGTSFLGLILNQTRSDALLFGVLIAIWSHRETYRLVEPLALLRRPLLKSAIFCALLLCLAAIGSQELHLVSFQVGLVALISAVLVLLASFDRDYLLPDCWLKQGMIWLGSRSYAIYVIHIPAFFLTREIWYRIEPPGTVFDGAFAIRYLATGLTLLLVFADLNYRFVEAPLRRRGARLADRLVRRTVPQMAVDGVR
jgi:peptidoglycan/LPS O-acetylase OafA/YrhL